MEEYILNGVGKKMRTGYLNGSVSKDKILSMYNKNKKEADNFSFFGLALDLVLDLCYDIKKPTLKGMKAWR